VLGNAPAKEVLLSFLEKVEKGHFRHFTPHSGGVIASRYPLKHYSPLQRSTGGIRLIQFDKDDAEALGLIKLDLLGLRMLSVLERARDDIHRLEGLWLDLADLPDVPALWRQIQEGDTLGLFQIESPAQARISIDVKPETLTDLAHQIALVRPGPIQSGTVHPYIRRRQGKEPITYPHPALEPVLEKSYGVVLFQEDVLRIAVHFAGYSWSEADTLRKRASKAEEESELELERQRFIEGAIRTTQATRNEAEAVFAMIAAFKGYGFAESHAWAFAQHAYTSAYLRHYYPAEYFAAVLTEQPGMWPRATIRQELRCWEVPVLPLDINTSSLSYRCDRQGGRKTIRPPLSAVEGISQTTAREILLARLEGGSFHSIDDFFGRVKLDKDELQNLIRAGAFDSLHPRREALYRANALLHSLPAGERPLLTAVPGPPRLEPLTVAEIFAWDHALKGFSEQELHVMDFLRPRLREINAVPLIQLRRMKGIVLTAGLVVARQKPPTANGFAFFILEDAFTRVQLIISPDLWDSHSAMLQSASVLLVEGMVEAHGSQIACKGRSRSGRVASAIKAERVWSVT
jgi:error-prone DNA polymerase